MNTRGLHPGGPSLDAAARDLYTRAHLPYQKLLQEAARERLLKPARSEVTGGRRLALAVADGLIAAGKRIHMLAGRPVAAGPSTAGPD